MVQSFVNIEAKTSLKSNIMVQDSDIHCPKNHCLFNNIASKIQIKGITVKDLYLKNPEPKKQSQLLSKLWNFQSGKIKKKGLKSIGKTTPGSETKLWSLATTLSTPQRRAQKRRVTRVKSYVITAIRRDTMLALAPNVQKTSIGLGNLRTVDWWWWESHC